MTFCVGDIVRLNRGWTPMVVIGFEEHRMIAKYASNPYYPITQEDFDKPYLALSTQKRHPSGFTEWDGEPLNPNMIQGKTKKMPTQYTIIDSKPPLIGTLVGKTTSGLYIIEFPFDNVQVCDPSEVEELLPDTFTVKNINAYSTKTTNFTVPPGQSFKVDDYLFNHKGELVQVTKINTKFRGYAPVFQGKRIVTEDL